jgi:hypothetical protein
MRAAGEVRLAACLNVGFFNTTNPACGFSKLPGRRVVVFTDFV